VVGCIKPEDDITKPEDDMKGSRDIAGSTGWIFEFNILLDIGSHYV
jgi:hypothetical protein